MKEIINVELLDDYKLLLTFSDKTKRIEEGIDLCTDILYETSEEVNN